MNLEKDCYNSKFSHIYVEKGIRNHDRTRKILEHFKDSQIIEIDHYKDVFCRRAQDYGEQHQSKQLIIAGKYGNLFYEGAPVCQSFGNEYFYYTSCAMNCIFDCEYCYLKGMYPSGNLVIFVNLEDYYSQLEEILSKHSAYVCISYDTDLLAIEELTGFVKAWNDFAAEHDKLKLELRTKCGSFTISPDKVIKDYEHQTASLNGRLESARLAMEAGFGVRLCFDPMIFCADWKSNYEQMLMTVKEKIDIDKLEDVSVGSFRISQDYLKKMRKNATDSAVAWFPYENCDGYYQYPQELMQQMESYLVSELEKCIAKEKIFRWK